jgi:hypothetical protein
VSSGGSLGRPGFIAKSFWQGSRFFFAEGSFTGVLEKTNVLNSIINNDLDFI